MEPAQASLDAALGRREVHAVHLPGGGQRRLPTSLGRFRARSCRPNCAHKCAGGSRCRRWLAWGQRCSSSSGRGQSYRAWYDALSRTPRGRTSPHPRISTLWRRLCPAPSKAESGGRQVVASSSRDLWPGCNVESGGSAASGVLQGGEHPQPGSIFGLPQPFRVHRANLVAKPARFQPRIASSYPMWTEMAHRHWSL